VNGRIERHRLQSRVAQRLENAFGEDLAYSRRVTFRREERGLTARLLETLALPIRDLL